MSAPVDVLVTGAGPAGLTLALQAHALGAQVRVIERRPEPFRPSRALIVHPRTLEVLRPLGVVEAVLARSDPVPGSACTSEAPSWRPTSAISAGATPSIRI